jgi:hypothetical protein
VGQRAILVALAYPEAPVGRPTKGSKSETNQVHPGALSQARCIVKWCPEYVEGSTGRTKQTHQRPSYAVDFRAQPKICPKQRAFADFASPEKGQPMTCEVAYHTAAVTVIARAIDIAVRAPARRSELRLHEGDIFPDDSDRSAERLERRAVVALAGHIALNRYQSGAHGDRDGLLARDLVFSGLVARYGPGLLPGFVRGYVRNRMAELTAEAEQMVSDHWPAIEAEAANLLAAPHRQAG